MWTHTASVGRQAAYPSVDEVVQELEGGAAETAAGDDVYGQYAWEREVERSWDLLVGDSEAYSEMHAAAAHDDRAAKGRRSSSSSTSAITRDAAAPEAHIKKGLLRSLVLLVDMSEATREKDYRPDRLTCICQATEEFISAFLLQSPLAQVALVALVGPCAEPLSVGGSRDAIAAGAAAAAAAGAAAGAAGGSSSSSSAYCSSSSLAGGSATAEEGGAGGFPQFFSSNAEECISALKEKRRRAAAAAATSGAPSLRNGLQVAKDLLSLVPPYCTREILILYGSLRTCDVGNIEETLLTLKKARICCNVICLAAELHVLKRLCQETGGRHSVPMHREHLRSLILQNTRTPPWSRRMQPCLIRMGFPSYKLTSTAALCGCHQRLIYAAYVCPQCNAKLCNIPSRCRCCFLHLVSPADISRAFHNLCPPAPFEVLANDFPSALRVCAACGVDFDRGGGSRCPDCLNIFCADCDAYTHEQLRQCAFCVVRDIAGLDEEKAENEEKEHGNGAKLNGKTEESRTESGGSTALRDGERNPRVKVEMPREKTVKLPVKTEK